MTYNQILKELVPDYSQRLYYPQSTVYLNKFIMSEKIDYSKYECPYFHLEKEMELSEDKVNVKVSFCQKCGRVVRSAIEHKMDIKSKNEFAKEVLKYDLAVKTIPLLEYRKMDMSKWCSC